MYNVYAFHTQFIFDQLTTYIYLYTYAFYTLLKITSQLLDYKIMKMCHSLKSNIVMHFQVNLTKGNQKHGHQEKELQL